MAEIQDENPHERVEHPSRANALSQIQFASIVDPELTPSEDETPETPRLQAEEAQSVIGFSIGQEQTRLTSPKTPAAEKAAALDDLDGGGFFDKQWPRPEDTIEEHPQREEAPSGHYDGPSDSNEESGIQLTSSNGQHEQPVRLPSPWRAGPKRFQRFDDHRASIRDSFMSNRRRASSGGSTTEALRKYLPFSLPSMPKTPNMLNFTFPTFSVSSGLDMLNRERPSGDATLSKKSSLVGYGSIVQSDGSHQSRTRSQERSTWSQRQLPGIHDRQDSDTPSSTTIQEHHPNTAPMSSQVAEGQSASHQPQLRRSASDHSLLLHRALSRASSLGDDSRFEHVQEQVNSRLKALKDSWQDANFQMPKFPSIPTLPNFNFGSREDLLKRGNITPRASDPTASISNRSSSLLVNPSALARGVSRSRKTSNAKAEDSAGTTGASASYAASHPFFTRALKDLSGDLVVLGGYRGSILRSAEPPNKQVWVPIKIGLNLRKVDLEVGLNPEDEETMERRIIPDGMLTHIGPVDISRRLFKRLRASENAKNGSLRVHDYGYDWRLSPHILSRKMIQYLEKLPCNAPGTPKEKRGALVIAHSLGGLITRHVINQRPDLVSGVIYAGVPHTCVNILGPFRNGDDVLLSSRVLTAQVNFTIRTSFALLPLDGKCFINKHTKEEYPVDFFDVRTWTDYCLSPCVGLPLPPLQTTATNGSINGLISAMSNALPNLPILGRKGSISRGSNQSNTASTNATSNNHDSVSQPHFRDMSPNHIAESGAQNAGVGVNMSKHQAGNGPTEYNYSNSQAMNPATAVTIPKNKAVEYLTRTLSDVKKFKQDLAFDPALAQFNAYPPVAVIYGKSTPTVYGAKVESREAIKRADAYDELAFASGDGVVLARAAMVPEGYSVVRGGVVSSDRGHVTLLGDLEAVGRCLSAVVGARKRGVGMGLQEDCGKEKARVEA